MAVEYYGRGSRRPRIEERSNTGRPTFLRTIFSHLNGTDDGTKWGPAFVSGTILALKGHTTIDISARGDRFAQLYDVTCQGGVVQPLI